jgi:aryl-alcohol dehydrogenase-like predicted oxidoreductase
MVASVEESLRRLGTDYLDLLYLHAWDATTPVEEVLRAMDDLVAAGKTLYAGISDTPAWQVSRMQAIAALRGWAPLIALQVEYSLIERTPERDLIPMAREMGLGVIPWSPLASGVLTGKYGPAELDPAGGAADPEGTRKKRGRRERVADRAGPGHRRGGQGRRRRTRRHPPDDPPGHVRRDPAGRRVLTGPAPGDDGCRAGRAEAADGPGAGGAAEAARP